MDELQKQDSTSKSQVDLYVRHDEAEMEDGLDIMQVFTNMGKKKRIYCWLMVICLLLGGSIGVLMFKTTVPKGYTSTVIMLKYEQARAGLAPDESILDVSMIKSPSVIEAALSELSWDDNRIDAESVRRNISISGIVPESTLNQREIIKTMAEKDPSYYGDLLNIPNISYQYIISITNGFTEDELELKSSELRELLDEIVKSYKEYFFDTYADKELPIDSISYVSYEDYDYVDVIDVIRSQIDSLGVYVEKLNLIAPEYVLSETGMSFSDMQEAVELIERVNLDKFLSYVYTNNLSKNIDNLVDSYTYRFNNLERQITVAKEQLDSVNSTIGAYKKDKVVIASGDNNSAQMASSSTEYYNELIQRRITISREIAEYEASRDKLTLQIAGLQDCSANASYNDKLVVAEKDLAEIINLLDSCIQMVNEAAEEFMASELYSNDYLSSISAQYYEDGLLSSEGMKKIGIGAVAGAFIAFVVWGVDGLVTELNAGRKKKEEAQK